RFTRVTGVRGWPLCGSIHGSRASSTSMPDRTPDPTRHIATGGRRGLALPPTGLDQHRRIAGEDRSARLDECLGALARPAAVNGIVGEFALDLLIRERVLGAAAHMRLAYLDHAAV